MSKILRHQILYLGSLTKNVSADILLLIRWWIHSAKGLILDAMSFVKIISDCKIKTHILFITRIQSRTEKDYQLENKEY